MTLRKKSEKGGHRRNEQNKLKFIYEEKKKKKNGYGLPLILHLSELGGTEATYLSSLNGVGSQPRMYDSPIHNECLFHRLGREDTKRNTHDELIMPVTRRAGGWGSADEK